MSNWYKPRYKIVKRLQEKTFIARLGRLRFFQDRRVQKFLRWKKGPLGRHTRGMTSLSWYKLRFSFGLRFYNFSTKKRRKFRFFRQNNLYKVELSRKKGFLSFYRKIDNSKVVNWFNKLYKNSRQFKLLNFFRIFESRLDVLCFRLKLMPTIFIANFFIKNRGLSINHRSVNTPGYRVQIGDLLHFTDPKIWSFFSLRLTNLLWKRWHRHQEINKVRKQTRVLTYREVLNSSSKKGKFPPSEFFPSVAGGIQLQTPRDLNGRVTIETRKKKVWYLPSLEKVEYFQLFYNLLSKNRVTKTLTSVKRLLLKIIYEFFRGWKGESFAASLREVRAAYRKLIHSNRHIDFYEQSRASIRPKSRKIQSAERPSSNFSKSVLKAKLGGASYSLSALEWLSGWIKGAAFLLENHKRLKKIVQFLMINFSVNSDLRIFFLRLWSAYRKINAPLYKLAQTSGRLVSYLRLLSRVPKTLSKKLHPTLFRSLYLRVLTLQFSSYTEYKGIVNSYSSKNTLNLIQLIKIFLLPLRLSTDVENAKKSFNDYRQKIDKIKDSENTSFEGSLNFFSKNNNFVFLHKQIGFRSKAFKRIFEQLRKEKSWVSRKASYKDLNLLFFSFTLNYLQDEFSFEASNSTKISHHMREFSFFPKNTIDSLIFRNFISPQVLEKDVFSSTYLKINKYFASGVQKSILFDDWRRIKFRALYPNRNGKNQKWRLNVKDLNSNARSERLFPRNYDINFKKILPSKSLRRRFSKQSSSPLNSLITSRERFYAKKRIQKRELNAWKKTTKGLIFSTSVLHHLSKRESRTKHLPPFSKKVINSYLRILSQKEKKKLLFDNTSLFKSLRFSVLTKNSLFANKYKKVLWEALRNVNTIGPEKFKGRKFAPFDVFRPSNSSRMRWKRKQLLNKGVNSLSKRLDLLLSLNPKHYFIKKSQSLIVNQKRNFLRKRQNRRRLGIKTWWNPNRGFSSFNQKSKTRAQNDRFKQKNLAHFVYDIANHSRVGVKKTHKKLRTRYYTQLRQKINLLLKIVINRGVGKKPVQSENLFRNLFAYEDNQNFVRDRLKYAIILTRTNRNSESVLPTSLSRTNSLNGISRHKIKRYKKSTRYRHNWNINLTNNKWYSIRSKIQQFHRLKAARRQKFTNIKRRPLLLFPNYVEFDFVAFRALITTFPNLEASLYGGADNSYFYNLLNFYQRKGL